MEYVSCKFCLRHKWHLDLAVCLLATCWHCWKTLSKFDNLYQAHGFDHIIQANVSLFGPM